MPVRTPRCGYRPGVEDLLARPAYERRGCDARADAAERAETASDAAPGEHVDSQVGDVDPLQAIEDALRTFPADEVLVLTAPDEKATWLEAGLGEDARERFSVPVTHLVLTG